MFEPLKVTAHPRCGIVADTYLPLDGILYYQAMRQLHGPQLLLPPGENPAIEQANLPLARLNEGPQWYYACSFAQWEESKVDGKDHWHKRFDQQFAQYIDFAGRRGNVIIEQGRYKAYHMPVFYRHALAVSWYAVGDVEAIRALLVCATHIGKKGSQGWGRINEWLVEPWPHDWSVYNDDARLMRAIPKPGGLLYGYRPSYWLLDNQAPCELPG
jgi:CRISPR type IV-associated protein Csf3